MSRTYRRAGCGKSARPVRRGGVTGKASLCDSLPSLSTLLFFASRYRLSVAFGSRVVNPLPLPTPLPMSSCSKRRKPRLKPWPPMDGSILPLRPTRIRRLLLSRGKPSPTESRSPSLIGYRSLLIGYCQAKRCQKPTSPKHRSATLH